MVVTQLKFLSERFSKQYKNWVLKPCSELIFKLTVHNYFTIDYYFHDIYFFRSLRNNDITFLGNGSFATLTSLIEL